MRSAHRVPKILLALILVLLLLTGCQAIEKGTNNTIVPDEPTVHAENGLINGWLSTYEVFVDEHGLLCIDWSSYQPSSGVALVCSEKKNIGEEHTEHTSPGNTLMETIEPGNAYRYAIWYGGVDKVKSIQSNPIPDSAWRYFYIDSNYHLNEVSKDYMPSLTQKPVINNTPIIITPNPTAKKTNTPKPTHTPTPVPDYTWKISFLGINSDPEDNYNTVDTLRVGDTVYFHAHLTGGAPNETIKPQYEISLNGELIENDSFTSRYGDDSYIWVRNTPFRHGTLSLTIYYIDGYGRKITLGTSSVHIEARTDQSITEIANGWIRGCDIYFNRYGSLCFDMTNYNLQGTSIIYFIRNDHQENINQGTISGGLVVWDTPTPGWIYEYAIWCGQQEYTRDVAALGANQIPSSAWIKLYVKDDRQVVVLSADIAINIKENE